MSGDTDRVSRREVWAEVGLNILVRSMWAAWFLACGAFIRDVWHRSGAVVLFVLAAAVGLALTLLFEYQRSYWRLRRQLLARRLDEARREEIRRQAIGEFHDQLPVGEWVYRPELGFRFKRMPDFESANTNGAQEETK